MNKTYIFTYGNLQVIFCGYDSETGCWHVIKKQHPDWLQANVEVEIESSPCVFEREVE